MQVTWGVDAAAKKAGQTVPVAWQSASAINGHVLLAGMTGAGKTYQLRRVIREMQGTSDGPIRFHVFDVHGDIDIEGASTVLFSEQTPYGFNPLRINADQHFGGIRRRVQEFIATMNRAMRPMGTKQEAALRNLLYDVYARHGFDPGDPRTWRIDDQAARLLSDGTDNRLYIDVPLGEKDDAKALGARWDPGARCWHVVPTDYHGAITRWPPKTVARACPTIEEVMHYAKHILEMAFLGAGMETITALELTNRAAKAFQRKLLEALRRGERAFEDEKMNTEIDKCKDKAIAAFTEYVQSISSGHELANLLKYDSTEVLKSVVDRLENLHATGLFKATPPPFDADAAVWRYNIRPLSMSERKLFTLFRLEALFAAAVQRGEQPQIVEVAILDEAHIYADDDPENIINFIAREARKFGLAMVCASQNPGHFTEDFLSAVATKVILGIDEMFWPTVVRKMRVPEEGLSWIRHQQSALVQIKSRGETKNEWRWAWLR